MAHLSVELWRRRRRQAVHRKVGSQSSKAYVAAAQRASAGEAHGAGGSIEAPHGLWPSDTVA